MDLNWINSLKDQFVWITQPSPHGNGGWCGDKVLIKTTLEEALKINPYKKWALFVISDWQNDIYYGAEYRISTKPDSNYGIYIFGQNYRWEKL